LLLRYFTSDKKTLILVISDVRLPSCAYEMLSKPNGREIAARCINDKLSGNRCRITGIVLS